MYRDKLISLVIPAYNEKELIGQTLDNVPEIVDKIYVVDDKSPDDQNKVVLKHAKKDSRISLLKHEINQGPGGSIITGYLASSKDNFDITVVTGGDDQMPLDEIPNLLDPIIDENYHYVKGNRFMPSKLKDTLSKMPNNRLLGNTLITALSKFSSGYYKINDFADGFTAISKEAIDTIDWSKAWKKYGYPMDFLVRLNAYGLKVKDVPRTAIYDPALRQTQIKKLPYIINVTPMLLFNFLWRIRFKYLYRDFHPLIIFYLLSFILLPFGIVFGLYLVAKEYWLDLGVSGPQSILCALMVLMGFQFLTFAIWFDMEEGK